MLQFKVLKEQVERAFGRVKPSALSKAFYGSRLGGPPVHNAARDDLRLPPGRWRYAAHLGPDLFDLRYGDAGSLHLWVDGARLCFMGDSA